MVDSLNKLNTNILMFLLIVIGALMIIGGHEAAGSSLITGSFAIFKQQTQSPTTGDK